MIENDLSKNLGVLLYEFKEQYKDLRVLKNLLDSNILNKDPVSTVNLIYNQLIISQRIMNDAFDRITHLFLDTFKQPEEPKDRPEDEPEDEPKDRPEDEPKDEPKDRPEDEPKDEPKDRPEDEPKEKEINVDTNKEDISEYIDEDYIKENKKEPKTNVDLSNELKKKIEEL